jgi:hypothetical protein
MDDTTARPDDPRKYTFQFGADGSASLRADCNRAHGPWTSEGPSRVELGPLAATLAACPEGSLSARVLRDIAYVRSWCCGGLYLSLMADGGVCKLRRSFEYACEHPPDSGHPSGPSRALLERGPSA